MKKILSLIVLVAFIFSQVPTAYGQQLIYPASNPTAKELGISQRTIKMDRVAKEAEYKKDKDKAMVEAIFEAEYKQNEISKEKERQERLRAPMRGKREEALIKRYKVEREEEIEEALSEKKIDLREKRPIAKKELRKIEKKIPKGIDLGSGFVRKINEKIYPVKISGEYQASWGYDWGDDHVNKDGHRTIWKNADFNKANMVYVLDNQYVFGQDRENTYDKRIYDRFRIKIESIKERGLNFLSETVVDPWSFVGQTDFFMLNSANGQLPLRLRYWSNTQSTLDERIWLTNGADFVNIPEIKVNNGKTHPTSVTSRWNTVTFNIPEMEINREFRPLRKLEASYKNDYLDFKIFPLADQDHSYVSDDPLILSNNHIYWEPSPWLDRWVPALYFPTTADFRRGKWANDISFESRDSDFNFLTLLRGLSFELNYKDTYLGGGVASPLTLWQYYDSINSIPGAVRFKQRLFRNYYVGTIYAFKYGLDEEWIDAYNHVIGVDAGYEIPEYLTFRGEFARSIDEIDTHGHTSHIRETTANGNAFRIEAKGEFFKDRGGNSTLKVSSSFTKMRHDFRARLSNYRNTRQDQYWGKHINFEPVSPDFDAFRIGNGIDIDRDVYHFRLENMLFEGKFNSLFDMRFVSRGLDVKKVENVYREEITIRPIANLIGKFLFRYQDLPATRAGIDPFIITDFISEDNTDEFLTNADIPGDENADVWTWSFGLHYDPVKWLGLEGIYEHTNDYDIFPQLTLNDAGFRDLGDIRELNYFLYGQPLIAIPPYDDYDIYKARIFFRPLDNIRTKFEYIINGFKHATGRDDNISHYGVEVDIDITKKLHASFKFIRSQLIDLFMQQQRNTDVPFYHHNNIFAKVEYDIDDNNTFTVQFGEFFVPAQFTAVPWLLNTVDTQRIVRFYLKGKF